MSTIQGSTPTNTPNEYNNETTVSLDSLLMYELSQIDSIAGRNPQTGESIPSGGMLGKYSNRLFGAPYQLLDSVDRRFPSVNSNVGNEYLRNFLLNSPILYVRPGMPEYTGNKEKYNISTVLRDIIFLNHDVGQTLAMALAGNTILGRGSQLQSRMFGFKPTYSDYMESVNLMCRTVAGYLGLSDQSGMPIGTFVNNGSSGQTFTTFGSVRWENYRMFNTYVQTQAGLTGELLSAIGSDIGNGASSAWSWMTGKWNSGQAANKPIGNDPNQLNDISAKLMNEGNTTPIYITDPATGKKMVNPERIDDVESLLNGSGINIGIQNAANSVAQSFANMSTSKAVQTMNNYANTVEFMVEPVAFTEQLSNTTQPSMIESMIDSLGDGIGTEIAFITNSKADVGALGELTKFIGGTVDGLASKLQQFVEPVTGGLLSNVISGAVGALKGQKMIYPEIYKESNSMMNYQFTVNLSSPYGDIYNYYMNIVVPLMHLIAMATPRLVSANSTTSPYLIQCFIPGMCTCQLGIIDSMEIQKNPTSKRVSVHGFPLDVKVTFTVKELYNAMAISPANDPMSFIYNETLMDYLSNLAGLIPDKEATYTERRQADFNNSKQYWGKGIFESATSGLNEGIDGLLRFHN